MRSFPHTIPLRRQLSGLRLIFFFSLLAAAGPSWAQQDKPRIPATPQDEIVSVETTLVTLPVNVLDRHGHVLTDLKREQFHVYEDGIEQTISLFEPPADSGTEAVNPSPHAFTIALLLDVSDSTSVKLEQIQRAALSFTDLLRPDDRVLVASFDKNVQVLTAATTDHAAIRKAITNIRTGGGTSLYTALELVIRQHLDRAAGPKAIVLLTDGVDTSSKGVNADDALQAAIASDAVIYPIQYDTYGDFADSNSRETYGAGEFGKVAHVTRNGEPASEAYKRATLYLRLLADKTGGHFQYADSLKNLSRSFEGLASKLRQQYTLGYYPRNKSADGTVRRIKVEVAAPKVTVRTRTSYVYKPRAP